MAAPSSVCVCMPIDIRKRSESIAGKQKRGQSQGMKAFECRQPLLSCVPARWTRLAGKAQSIARQTRRLPHNAFKAYEIRTRMQEGCHLQLNARCRAADAHPGAARGCDTCRCSPLQFPADAAACLRLHRMSAAHSRCPPPGDHLRLWRCRCRHPPPPTPCHSRAAC